MAGREVTTIAFVAHRANYLRHYGPVIDAALERGWRVECWLQDMPLGEKEYQRITSNMVTALWGERVIARTFGPAADVAQLNSAVKPDAIISLHSRSMYLPGPENERFITLQHSVDLFAVNTLEELASSDFICLYTPFWLDYGIQYYGLASGASREQVESALASKVAYTGFAQMDAFAKIDVAEVRQRWKIPQGKKVVLALPVDLAGWPGAWAHFFQKQGLAQWKSLWKARKEPGFVKQYWHWPLWGWNDSRLARVLKEFADNNDAVLLLKGREKDLFRPKWQEIAFRSFYDEKHYPATIFEAIAVADVCVLFYSTATQEAVYAGVPVVCIDRPNRDTIKHSLWRKAQTDGPYSFAGAVYWMTMPQAIRELPDASLAEFALNEEARQQYLAKYNGPADHEASQRILDLVIA